jgi:hypothetical protein
MAQIPIEDLPYVETADVWPPRRENEELRPVCVGLYPVPSLQMRIPRMMRCPDDLVVLDKRHRCLPPVTVFELEYETKYELSTLFLRYYPITDKHDPVLASLRHTPFLRYLDTPGATCLEEQLQVVRFSGQDPTLLHLRIKPEVHLGCVPVVDILVKSGGHSCFKFRFDLPFPEWTEDITADFP